MRVPVYELKLVLVQERQSVDPHWNLICSVCFVDGPS